VAHVAFESAAQRSSPGARPCSTVAIPRALPALLMILLSACFRHLCHHQLRLAIDYTPDHQDDQGGRMGGCRAVLRRASTWAAASARTRCRSRPRRPEPGGLRLPGASTHTASAGPCAEDRAGDVEERSTSTRSFRHGGFCHCSHTHRPSSSGPTARFPALRGVGPPRSRWPMTKLSSRTSRSSSRQSRTSVSRVSHA
jgi:hypothetical protein